MTWATFFGCILLAYAPSAVLLLTYASRRSALLILTVIAAFFWLLAIFVSSAIWMAIPPIKVRGARLAWRAWRAVSWRRSARVAASLSPRPTSPLPIQTVHPYIQIVCILAQEGARLALVYCYVISEKAADRLVRRARGGGAGPKIFNDLSASLAAGLGFGGMHTVMMYGALLFASLGEPTFFLDSCPKMSIFAWTALLGACGESGACGGVDVDGARAVLHARAHPRLPAAQRSSITFCT